MNLFILPQPAKWSPNQAAPVDPMETVIRQRAQSLLTGELIGGVCPVLPIDQARDVLNWAKAA